MKFKPTLWILAISVALAGCTGSTATSRQPSQSEIEDAKANRLAEIDKLNVPQATKDRMKAQVSGTQPAPGGQRK